MRVHRPLSNGYVIAPDLIQQLRAAMHAFRMRHEEMQQTEFSRAEIELDIVGMAVCVRSHAMRSRIESQAIDGYHVVRQLRRAPAQYRLDPRHQFFRRKRLRHIVVRPDFKSEHLILLVAAGAEHDERNLFCAFVAAQFPSEGDAGFTPCLYTEVTSRIRGSPE